jgi:DNA-binding IclR family transcriptional regulator
VTHEHRTVHRIVGVLEAVARADGRPVSLSALTNQLETPKSTVHGFARGLVAEGYLEETPQGYVLGNGLHAVLGPAESSVVLLLKDVCEEIAVRTGETVTIVVRVADSVIYVHTTPSVYEVCYVPKLRVRRPLLPTSGGKLFLALAPRQSDATIAERFPAEVMDAYLAEREAIVASGVAYNRGETVPEVGAAAVGARIEGKIAAALSIAGPGPRVNDKLEYFGEIALTTLADAGLA